MKKSCIFSLLIYKRFDIYSNIARTVFHKVYYDKLKKYKSTQTKQNKAIQLKEATFLEKPLCRDIVKGIITFKRKKR